MKAFLHDGSPVGVRQDQELFVQLICHCPECIHCTAWDPTISKFVSGKACGRGEYYEHQRRLRTLQASLPCFPPAAINDSFTSVLSGMRVDDIPIVSSMMLGLPDHNPEAEQVPVPSASAATRRSQRQSDIQLRDSRERIRSTQDAASIYILDELSRKCEEIKSHVQEASLGDVTFVNPPSPHQINPVPSASHPQHTLTEVNSGPYALEFGRSSNKHILELEVRLTTALTEVDAVLAGDRPKVLSRKKAVTSEMIQVLERIDKLKRKEWERRFKAQGEARQLYLGGRVSVVDTSKSSDTLQNMC